MNELQILQEQLAVERQHFSRVGEALAAAVARGAAREGSVMRACAEYCELALTRLSSVDSSEARALLGIAQRAEAAAAPARWQDFLRAFVSACTEHFARIDALGKRGASIVEWRAATRLDADAVVVERKRFGCVEAALAAQ